MHRISFSSIKWGDYWICPHHCNSGGSSPPYDYRGPEKNRNHQPNRHQKTNSNRTGNNTVADTMFQSSTEYSTDGISSNWRFSGNNYQSIEISKKYSLFAKDALIVSSAWTYGIFDIVSHDKDFERVPRLTVYRPVTDIWKNPMNLRDSVNFWNYDLPYFRAGHLKTTWSIAWYWPHPFQNMFI